jgi:SAM-dependent methyltransferase
MTEEDVQQYLTETASIEGWFFPIDALLFGLLDAAQKRNGVAGNLFEIGVHHGKSAVLLARMLAPGELLGVCDVFGRQDLNDDHSGEGSRELFEQNISRFAARAAVQIFSNRSDELHVEDTSDRCRFMHIDGGHTPRDVVNDLEVAARALLPDGVVALDDAFNNNWPGVSEGLYRYAAANPASLVPLIIGGNKAYFVRPAAAARYEPLLRDLTSGSYSTAEAFRFEPKEWLGRSVLTATRREWVDLAPLAAARLHLRRGSMKRRIVEFLAKR